MFERNGKSLCANISKVDITGHNIKDLTKKELIRLKQQIQDMKVFLSVNYDVDNSGPK